MRDMADRCHANRTQVGEPRHGDAGANHDQRRGECGQTRSSDQEQHQGSRPDASVTREVSGRCCDEAQHVAEEALLRDVEPE